MVSIIKHATSSEESFADFNEAVKPDPYERRRAARIHGGIVDVLIRKGLVASASTRGTHRSPRDSKVDLPTRCRELGASLVAVESTKASPFDWLVDVVFIGIVVAFFIGLSSPAEGLVWVALGVGLGGLVSLANGRAKRVLAALIAWSRCAAVIAFIALVGTLFTVNTFLDGVDDPHVVVYVATYPLATLLGAILGLSVVAQMSGRPVVLGELAERLATNWINQILGFAVASAAFISWTIVLTRTLDIVDSGTYHTIGSAGLLVGSLVYAMWFVRKVRRSLRRGEDCAGGVSSGRPVS